MKSGAFKMKYFFIVVFSFFVLGSAFCEEKLIAIALSQSQNIEKSESDWLCSHVRDVFSEKIRENTDFVPTSSEEIEKQIIALQKKSESTAFDEKTALEMGKLVSANYALFSAIRKADGAYFLSATISDLTTGKTVATATSKGRKNAMELFSAAHSALSAIDEVMDKFLMQLGKKQPNEIENYEPRAEKPLSAQQKKAVAEKKEKNFLDMKFRHTDSLLTEYTGSDEVVIIPDFIYKIGFAAFRQCRMMKKVVFHDLVFRIEREAFAGTGLVEIEIPNTVLEIEKKAFFGCLDLQKAKIPSSIKVIPEQCFSGCTSLAEVEISEGITRLEKSAFTGCTALKKIVIPESVSYIGEFCFSGCRNLSEIVIKNPACVIANRAFYGCPVNNAASLQ